SSTRPRIISTGSPPVRVLPARLLLHALKIPRGIEMAEHVEQNRRGFLGSAALALATLSLGARDSSNRSATKSGMSRWKAPATSPPLGPVRQIDAGVLNVGYVQLGPPTGRAVMLLHGWPYDIQSYADVAPSLAEKGYRVVVPHLRGYGTTRF